MNKTLKALSVSWLLAICAIASGCGTSSDEPTEGEDSAAVTTNCATFCRNEGGPGFLEIGATSQSVCTARRGTWFASVSCCCKCESLNDCL